MNDQLDDGNYNGQSNEVSQQQQQQHQEREQNGIPEIVGGTFVHEEETISTCTPSNYNYKSAAVPPSATSVTTELRSKDTLLRRQILVDEIVAKLQESSNEDNPVGEFENVVLLRGVGGAGKSTLCSMVVSHRSTLLHFADGIAWLSLGQVRGEAESGMTYEMYMEYLRSICHQLDVDLPSCNAPLYLPTDSDSIRRRKVQRAMEEAQLGMSRLLANKHVLVVLDDVWSREAVSWLNFGNRVDSDLRVLVSTRLQGGFGRVDTFLVGELSVQEAVTLLVSESGYQGVDLEQEEQSSAIDVVTRCSLIPVLICIAGRMLASSSRIKDFRQLAKKISESLLFDDPQYTMINLIDRCFLGIGNATQAMKIAFVSLAAIFTTNEGKRVIFPESVAIKVIDPLLLPVDRKSLADSGINGTQSLVKELVDFGLLSQHGRGVQVRHDTGQEYAKQILKDDRERTLLFKRRLSHTMGKKRGAKSVRNSKLLVGALHHALVQAYMKDNLNWQTMEDDGYCFMRLPWHMIVSLPSHPSARQVLCSSSFLKQRISAMGILPGIKSHIQDIDELDATLHAKQDEKHFEDTVKEAFDMMSYELIAAEGTALLDAANAFILLASYLRQHCRFGGALEMYSRALALYRRDGLQEDDDLVKSVKELASRITFTPVFLTLKSRSSPDEDVIRFANVANLLAQQEKATSVSRSTSKSCVDTGVMLTLSSHPGMALCLGNNEGAYTGGRCTLLCLGPSESALCVRFERNKFVSHPGGKSRLVTSSALEGDMLYMATPSRFFPDRMTNKIMSPDLIINEDGSMSPRANRDMVFAVKHGPQLILVKRDSPCRLLLKYSRELQANTAQSVCHDCSVNGSKVFSAELISHPNQALVGDAEAKISSRLSWQPSKLGDLSDAMQLAYDGKKLAAVADESLDNSCSEYKCKFVLTMELGQTSAKSMPFFIRDGSGSVFKNEFAYGLHWIINDDGSLSPMGAPNHAIGLECLGSAELVVTDEERALAKFEANKSNEIKHGESVKAGLRIFRLLFL